MKEPEKRTEYLTAKQIAEILQVSESTIHRLRRQGRIPAILVTERLIRFNLRDVKAALHNTLKKNQAESDNTDQLSFSDIFSGFSDA